MSDLVFETVCELARKIRSREASADEVLDAHLEQIGKHNKDLNAIVTLDEEGARRRAREADEAMGRDEIWGPLHGVPITIKDCFETAGLRTVSGFPPLKDYIPRQDATAVARLRSAGAVVIGKTNLSELTTDWQSNNPVFGRTNSPWDAARTPGGSSGGSGAAVAAGLSALDLGSDIGGSIRVPAHFCGIYGLKPTEHRVPSTGHIPDWYIPNLIPKGSVRHMGVYGPLARSIADLQLCFSLIAGPDGHQPEVAPVSAAAQPESVEAEQLRLAWTGEFGSATPSPETRASLERVVKALEDAGCHAEQIKPRINFDRLWLAWGEIVAAEIAGPMPFFYRHGRRLQLMLLKDRSPGLRGMIRGTTLSKRDYARALAHRDEVVRAFDDLLRPYDAWLCPVSRTPAFTHRKPGSDIEVDGQPSHYFLSTGAYTTPFNLSGHPVVVIPVGYSKTGLPIGVQVVGHRWQDEALLYTAAALDDLVGHWKPPPGCQPDAGQD